MKKIMDKIQPSLPSTQPSSSSSSQEKTNDTITDVALQHLPKLQQNVSSDSSLSLSNHFAEAILPDSSQVIRTCVMSPNGSFVLKILQNNQVTSFLLEGEGLEADGRLSKCGCFGRVLKATNTQTGEVFACKACDLNRQAPIMSFEQFQENAKREAKIAMRVHGNQHVIGAFSVAFTQKEGEEPNANILSRDNDWMFLFMEYFQGTELFVKISDHSLSFMDKVLICKQIAYALKEVHDLHIIVRDLKPENILISHTEPFTIKLIDFGLSTFTHETVIRFGGTPLYLPPEGRYTNDIQRLVTNPNALHSLSAPYSTKWDIYSFAVVMFSVLTGNLPMGSDTQTLLRILNKGGYSIQKGFLGQFIPKNPSVRAKVFDILTACFQLLPENRPTIDDVISDLEQLDLITQSLLGSKASEENTPKSQKT